MPGLISAPTPSLVMPQTLCLAFSESREYAQLRNEYHDGTPQASQLARASRKTFKLSRRLTPSGLATLSDFYQNVSGPLGSFIFYNAFDVPLFAPIGSNFDSSGVNTVGRYVVAFRNNWTQASSFRRTDVTGMELVELAPMDATYELLAGFGSHGAINLSATTLNILSSHTQNAGTGVLIGHNVLSLFDRGWFPGSGDWTLRTDSTSLTGTIVGLSEIVSFNTAFPGALSPPESLLLYDVWIVAVFADGTTSTLRPQTYSVLDTLQGTIANPANAIDGSTGTFATLTKTGISTLDLSPALALRDFA